MTSSDWIDRLLRDNVVIELRHPDGDHWRSGLFDDAGALARVIGELQAANVYTSIARPRQAITATNAMNTRALTDADMVLRTRLVFDFDPVRPTGLPSTDSELHAAIDARNRLAATLLGQGWPGGARACSGNGAHLIFRADLPVNQETSEMLASLYRGLEADFSTPLVKFDSTVRNPGRIWRLYGTMNRKGTQTPDRPHRSAQVAIPARWEPVSPRMIAALADSYARRASERLSSPHEPAGQPRAAIQGAGDYATLDAASWFDSHGAYRRYLGGDKHAVRCPWAHEHSSESPVGDTSTVIWEAHSGRWPAFHCAHAHCDGRGIRDVLALWGDADDFCARAWRTSV